jgi:hypothetical protein
MLLLSVLSSRGREAVAISGIPGIASLRRSSQ